ncbi:MAG: hypothetical protein KBD78_14035 [Oligoflexales bacterium]|nr:hypothetical protein [Oligoflexales bacterium]
MKFKQKLFTDTKASIYDLRRKNFYRPTFAFYIYLTIFILFIVTIINHNSKILTQQIRLTAQLTDGVYSSTSDEELVSLRQQLRLQAFQYYRLIEMQHLEDGMIVNRDENGTAIDICDSLLFSSLYYVSLKKLGFESAAENTWYAIKNSKNGAQWLRHPKCLKPTSRDMLLGLLVALSQEPEDYKEITSNLFTAISKYGDKFGPGPFYVSRLSPGIIAYLNAFAKQHRIFQNNFETKKIKTPGFSTNEFFSVLTESGYTAHLVALLTWLEMELIEKNSLQKKITRVHTVLDTFGSKNILSKQRIMWISYQLTQIDSQNIFFQWLWLNSIQILNPQLEKSLLKRLLDPSVFPVDRLPNNCDRSADYLWQRDSREYTSENTHCTRFFSGVDFLWMAALLLNVD